METYSIHKGAQIAPRRARMTLDLIRGKNVSQAEAILLTTNTKASRLIIKVLNSAVANAVNFALGDNYPENIINIGLFPDSDTDYPSHEMSITSSSDVIIPLHYTKVIELPGRLEKLLVSNATTER
jgi:hypothetical protein